MLTAKTLILLSQLILAHEWYPIECCSGRDCMPVPNKEILIQEDGTVKYKDFIFTKDKIRMSPDGMYHVCIADKTPRCIFLPSGS